MIRTLSKFITCIVLSTMNVNADTDVFIADITFAHGQYTIQNPINITNRKGYDNQPYFNTDSSGVFFTSQFDSQTDIMFYDIKSRQKINISNTKDTSEYSPTPFLLGEKISFIKVEEDNTQRLWSMDIHKANPKQSLLNRHIKPVGYHAWGKQNDLALFVLGEPMMLQYIANVKQASGKVVANNIGRTIRYNATLSAFSFTESDQHVLSTYNPTSDMVTAYRPLPNATQDYEWLTDKTVVVGNGSTLQTWSIDQPTQPWQTIAEMAPVCNTQISRLAISNDTKKIAFVCEEKQ